MAVYLWKTGQKVILQYSLSDCESDYNYFDLFRILKRHPNEQRSHFLRTES